MIRRAGTPARFGFALRSWLRSAGVYQKTPPPGSTWTEGGCWLLARALLRWAGTGELWALWGKQRGAPRSGLQHVVWRHGDLYFDGDGASREETLLLRATADWYVDDADLAPWGPHAAAQAARNIECSTGDVARLVKALRHRFGKPAEWGFIQSTGRAGRRGRGALVQKIGKGKLLYHGTRAPDDFEFPDGPAWFSDSFAVAERFVTWNEWSGRERPRVLTYRVTSAIPRLARIRTRFDMESLAEEIGASDDSHELAEAACAAGYKGWIVPNNYVEGADILLCHPSRWLEFAGVTRVKIPAGRAARERAVVPGFGATDLHVHPYVSPRQQHLTREQERVREVAIALKKPSSGAQATAAAAMAGLVKHPSPVLVPIPDSRGDLAANLDLARALAARLPAARIRAGLRREAPVESSRSRRLIGRVGLRPEHHGLYWVGPRRFDPAAVYFVDNVIVTGGTIEAARRVLGGGTGLAWARQELVP